ncbi:HERV-H LTR-associating protein 1 [Podarcis raffonei]|uniref:HERV-H LTR-associating protein 1 n=1 Tax=Podarcis raffonei TaxID=65483 RepID=UPI0023294C4B|nr:HERV-H LTR-associating protein 1 [Podarcis raffonei]
MSWFPLHGAVNVSLGFLCLLFASSLAESVKGESKKVAVLATAELPAKSVDLAAINLTELVNGMLNTALKGSKKFFSLLSITSYSSYAFHKVSIVVYNISNLKNIDPTKFPMRYCYCLNNRTNDLTDFTALLVDIVGNSTDSLKEIFKSTSIVSVSQGNDTDCIYICVMSGRTGRNLSDLWEAIEKSPFINYTFSGNVSDLLGLDLILPGLVPLWEDDDKVLGDAAKDTWTFKTTKIPRWSQTGDWKGKEMPFTQDSTIQKSVSPTGFEASSSEVPLWLQTEVSRAYEVSSTTTASTGSPPTPLGSYGSPSEAPATLTPEMPAQPWTIAAKGDGASSPPFTMWQQTPGLKGAEASSFQESSWLQTDAAKEWAVSPTAMASSLPPLSYSILPGTQPVPTTGIPLPLASPSIEQVQDALKTRPPPSEALTFWTRPASLKRTKAPRPMQTMAENMPLPAASTPQQRPAILLKVPSRCPRAMKKGTSMTTPYITAQKINPCVMELCKFFQQCLCARDRSYSRDEAMRYCIENYSWFLKNATYICEKVKRAAHSRTLKQKCLASICRAI